MFLQGIVFFIVFFFTITSMFTIFCRDASHFHGLDPVHDAYLASAFINRLYFTVMTFATIGCSDIMPQSYRARIILVLSVFFLIVLVLQSLDNLRVRLETGLNPLKAKIEDAEKKVEHKLITPPHTGGS
jgi:voltage-gated potassium channel Kch